MLKHRLESRVTKSERLGRHPSPYVSIPHLRRADRPFSCGGGHFPGRTAVTVVVSPVELADIAARFRGVRQRTLDLCAGLSAEDLQIQSMADASPGKWHLAHTTWFFEQFVLARDPAWHPREEAWLYLFNSYYQSVGPMHARPQRGLLSRPSLDEVLAYRRYVDDAVGELLASDADAELTALVELGLQHEQQHQE
jgi:hypothetical protein